MANFMAKVEVQQDRPGDKEGLDLGVVGLTLLAALSFSAADSSHLSISAGVVAA